MEEEQINKKDIHTKKTISTIQDTAWVIALLTGLCYFLSFSFEKGSRDYYGIDEIALSELGTSSIVNAIYNMSPIVLLCFGAIIGSYILSIFVKPFTKWLMKYTLFFIKSKGNYTNKNRGNFTGTDEKVMEKIIQTVLKSIIFLFLCFYFLPSLILGNDYKSLLELIVLFFSGVIGSGVLTAFLGSFISFLLSGLFRKKLMRTSEEMEEAKRKLINDLKEIERVTIESTSRQKSQTGVELSDEELSRYIDEKLEITNYREKLENLLKEKIKTDKDEENFKSVFEGNLLYNLWSMSNLGIKFTIIGFIAFLLSRVLYEYGYTQAEKKEDYSTVNYRNEDLIVLDKNNDLLLVTPFKKDNDKFMITKEGYRIINLKPDKLHHVTLKNVKFKNGLATNKNNRKEFFINTKEILKEIAKDK